MTKPGFEPRNIEMEVRCSIHFTIRTPRIDTDNDTKQISPSSLIAIKKSHNSLGILIRNVSKPPLISLMLTSLLCLDYLGQIKQSKILNVFHIYSPLTRLFHQYVLLNITYSFFINNIKMTSNISLTLCFSHFFHIKMFFSSIFFIEFSVTD
jgi:hypothetical protein